MNGVMKTEIEHKLDKYGYKYGSNGNKITVKLGHSQMVDIDFTAEEKVIIKDRLTGWNFISGMIPMSLKGAMVYNTAGLIILAILLTYLNDQVSKVNLTIIFVFGAIWISMWTGYYVVKFENFKRQVIQWCDMLKN